jgi:hypothetical protein
MVIGHSAISQRLKRQLAKSLIGTVARSST